MSSKHIHSQHMTIPRYKRVPGSSWQKVQDGTDEIIVHIHVDAEQIARKLGGRAFHNKKGVARYMEGAVLIEAQLRAARKP